MLGTSITVAFARKQNHLGALIFASFLFACPTKSEQLAEERADLAVSRDSALAAPESAKPCVGDNCLRVPEGIIGLVFGSSEKDVKERVGRLSRVKHSKRTVTAATGCARDRAPPTNRYRLKTTLGGEKSTCLLDFTDELGLLRIDCRLDGRRTTAEHAETTNLLFSTLTKQYGKPSMLRDSLARNGRVDANWKDSRASLAVTAFARGKRSKIGVSNHSLVRLKSASEAELADVAAECAAEKAERDADADEREQRLRDKARRFEDDLRPPLEAP